ncbi:MAG: hypothetical protein AAFO29_00995 [Actinomycetota bacterium]
MSAPVRPTPASPGDQSGPELGLTRPATPAAPSARSAAPSSTRSTPSFLKRWNVILMGLVAAFAVVGSVASLIMGQASSTTASNTAPALVGIQDLFASVAEANTAATAAFLATDATGTEDRINRNLYQDAIRRAAVQAEDVSATIGSDEEAHSALRDIAVDLNTYSGRIEASRVENINDLPGADAELRSALELVRTDIGGSVATITERGRAQLDEERGTGRTLTWAAVALGVVTLVALLRVQSGLLGRTNRVFNPLLVVATALVATVVGYLVIGPASRAQALDQASEGGYDAIATTSAIQTAAFDLQSQLSLTILDGSGESLDTAFASVDEQIAALSSGVDSDRERAAAETLEVRWARYQDAATRIQAEVDAGRRAEAVALFQGEGLAAFNGLNTAVESVLSDNRDQFLNGVDDASAAVELTPYLTIVLPVLAALAILLAIQRRLGEYR